MNPQVNEDRDFDYDYEDDYFDGEMELEDAVQDRMLNTIKEMMEEGNDDRTDMPFEDFIIAANLIRKSDRIPGHAQYLHSLSDAFSLQSVTGTTTQFYSIKENIHGHWIVSDDKIGTNGVIGYLIGGAKVDLNEFYVEFSA